MKTIAFGSRALGIGLAAALLAACGSQANSPMPVGNAAMIQAKLHGHSWMLPEAKNEALLYVAPLNLAINVYTYPKAKLVGSITLGNNYYPSGTPCTDTHGNLFVPAYTYDGGNGAVYEYAHGGTSPIAVLADSTFAPQACSVDPTTGNLAVVNGYEVSHYRYGNVAIYPSAQGNPIIYSDPALQRYVAPAYDNKGNLFVTGYGAGPSFLFVLAELAAGGDTFVNVTVNETAFQLGPGDIQWDGKYLAISSEKDNVAGSMILYRLKVEGSSASIVKTIRLRNWKYSLCDFWIQGSTIISNAGGKHAHWKRVVFWQYPHGGELVSYFSAHGYALGVAVSVAPSH